MEVNDKNAIIMKSNGEFVKIRTNKQLKVGDEIDSSLFDKRIVFSNVFNISKVMIMRITSVAAALVLIFGMAYGAYSYNMPYSYISIDINPSIEIIANRFDRIIALEGIDDDGKVIAGLSTYKHVLINEGIQNIINSAVQEGYINKEKNNTVFMTLSSKNQNKIDQLDKILETAVSEQIQSSGVNAELYIEKVSVEKHMEAEKLGVSPGKLVLIEKLKEKEPETEIQNYAEATVQEIMHNMENSTKEEILKNRMKKGADSSEEKNTQDKNTKDKNNHNSMKDSKSEAKNNKNESKGNKRGANNKEDIKKEANNKNKANNKNEIEIKIREVNTHKSEFDNNKNKVVNDKIINMFNNITDKNKEIKEINSTDKNAVDEKSKSKKDKIEKSNNDSKKDINEYKNKEYNNKKDDKDSKENKNNKNNKVKEKSKEENDKLSGSKSYINSEKNTPNNVVSINKANNANKDESKLKSSANANKEKNNIKKEQNKTKSQDEASNNNKTKNREETKETKQNDKVKQKNDAKKQSNTINRSKSITNFSRQINFKF